jgi:SAM-dependent methyltransferase
MALEIKETLLAQVRATGIKPARVLEVGGVAGPKSLLDAPELALADKFVLNLAATRPQDGVTAVRGNANDMPFEDESFDLVLTISTLEHDQKFWLSVAEMKRVLRPGGMLVIGVPGYVRDPERDRGRRTVTYRVHFKFDYYRFSEQAVREVFFEGMERVEVGHLLRPPRIVGHGFKP